MSKESIIWQSICAIMFILFSGNVFFAGKTLNRLDSIEAIVYQLRQEVAILHITLNNSNYNLVPSLRGDGGLPLYLAAHHFDACHRPKARDTSLR